jgi:hypothetical protein
MFETKLGWLIPVNPDGSGQRGQITCTRTMLVWPLWSQWRKVMQPCIPYVLLGMPANTVNKTLTEVVLASLFETWGRISWRLAFISTTVQLIFNIGLR